MRVVITVEVAEECTDENDSTGLTEWAFERVHDALSSIGEDINIEKEEN